MAKKKYVKPVMTSEAFVTDSYCAVCGPVAGGDQGTLYATCGDGSTEYKINITNNYEGNISGGVDGLANSNGVIKYYDSDKGREYVYTGSINDKAHNPDRITGEYSSYNEEGYIFCGEHQDAGRHHHLTNVRIVYQNNS